MDGTPTDCVYLALHHLLDASPDYVISGINHGPNLGEDVWYFGTVNAALEAASSGVRSIAISQEMTPDTDWVRAGEIASQVIQWLLNAWPKGVECVNVNIPPESRWLERGWRWAALGERDYGRTIHAQMDPRGQPYFWIGGLPDLKAGAPDTDCALLKAGWITVTPLTRDATDRRALTHLLNSEAE